MFSRRTGFDRTENALARALATQRAKAPPADGELVDLTGSNPTTAGLPYDGDAIGRALANPRSLVYRPESFGLTAAREALAARLPLSPSPDRILLTASTSEAYSLTFKLLCDPGDAVAIPEPSYPLFEHLATLEGVRLLPYRLSYDGAWHVDLDSVRGAVAGGASAIVVVSPNNPTGSILGDDEHAALGAFGLPILSDEVFAEYMFDGASPTTARARSDVLTFTMGGLSKSCALPQMKLAWTCITGPERDVAEAVDRLEIVADAYLSPSAPVQVALPELLRVGDVTRQVLLRRIETNRARLALRLAERHAPVTLLRAAGGWTACLRFPKTRSEDEWVLGLLAGARVLVQPGAFYDFHDEPIVVVSLIGSLESFRDGVERMLDYVTR